MMGNTIYIRSYVYGLDTIRLFSSLISSVDIVILPSTLHFAPPSCFHQDQKLLESQLLNFQRSK